jgi:hypothetical protein
MLLLWPTLGALAFGVLYYRRHLDRAFKAKQWKPRLNNDPSFNMGQRKDDDVGGEQGT